MCVKIGNLIMNKEQKERLKPILRKLISEVKSELKEDVENQDMDYLYRVLKTAGPKISAAIDNLYKKYRADMKSDEFQRIAKIQKGWNEVAFGVGELNFKTKK